MDGLLQLRNKDNLRRAWRWIKSNPDAGYKNYFRSLYSSFAIAEDVLLSDLADRLKRGIYQPARATKVFYPKASGILRPYSLLSVEDQIVYQAAVNLIAEKLAPKIRHRYHKAVFGHLYARKSSIWFYQKWSKGYAALNKASREAVNTQGFIYAASFDLTACYDSLDHRVLCHFLNKLGFDGDFCQKLTDWLGAWTATREGIFHGHGIPQGPLSSGLLAEVVLQYFDDAVAKGTNYRYLRYVDDIKLFAKDEKTLRQLLVRLDHCSKDVGLFPQGSKIEIHKVADIESELKTVSHPVESAITRTWVDQKRLRKRIVELSPRYRVSNPTRFKYLLGCAAPCSQLTTRLWRILDNHPELYRNVAHYFRRYDKIPKAAAEHAIAFIKNADLYQGVRAEFVAAVDGDSRLPEAIQDELAAFLKSKWSPKTMQADLLVAVAGFLVRVDALTQGQVKYVCRAAPSWWSQAKVIELAASDTISIATRDAIAHAGIKEKHNTPAVTAATYVFRANKEGRALPLQRNQWNRSAALLLRETGVIGHVTAHFCGIDHSLRRLDTKLPTLDWRKLFTHAYAQAEMQAVSLTSVWDTDAGKFVLLLDVFDDLLLDALFRIDGTIGGYHLGRIGSALSPTCRLAKKYPSVYRLCHEVHEKRLESNAAHPRTKSTGRPTKRIPFRFRSTARCLLSAAVRELVDSGVA